MEPDYMIPIFFYNISILWFHNTLLHIQNSNKRLTKNTTDKMLKNKKNFYHKCKTEVISN